MEDEIAEILREWDEARGLAGPTPVKIGKERIARARKSLKMLLNFKSFSPWKRPSPASAG